MSFYKDKNVTVCGGAGFIGVQLVKLLLVEGANVTVLDDFSRGRNEVPGALYFRANVASPETCKFWFEKDVDVVFNLTATVAGVLYNMNHHLAMYKDNIDVLAGPVMGAEMAGVPHFLQTSSVCVYDPKYNHPSLEPDGLIGDPHPANAGYAEAKRDGERLIQWGNLEHAVIIRPSNVFGPYDYFDEKAHVIPAIIKKAVEDEKIRVYGHPHVVREFIYSTDVAKGMLVAMESGEHRQAYNLGCGRSNTVTIGALIHRVAELSGNNHKEVVWESSLGGGDEIRYSSVDKMNQLGWNHEVDLEDGLARTIEWYKGKMSNG